MSNQLENRYRYPVYGLLISLFLVCEQINAQIQLPIQEQIKRDYLAYYQPDNLAQLGYLSLGAALFANSNLDATLRSEFQQHINTNTNLELFEIGTQIGDAGQLLISLPIYASVYLLSERFHFIGTNNLGKWGNRALRAALLAAPQHLLLGIATGAGRPTEGASSWRPFDDNNGVSGHALYGALPLITLARMTRQPWLRAAYYTASTLPGLARISDDKHYGSQVLFGWSLAYLSTGTIFKNDHKRKPLFLPMAVGGGAGIVFRMSF